MLNEDLYTELVTLARGILTAQAELDKAREDGETLEPFKDRCKSLRSAGACLAAAAILKAGADFRELPGYLKRALVPAGPVYDERLGEVLPF